MKRKVPDRYALVTGASKGLGKSFALELAKRKINMVLSSLPGENLDALAEEIKSKGVDAVSYEVDLTEKNDLLLFTEWVNENYSIYLLINNAGIGGTSYFSDTAVDDLDRMIQLNVRAPALLIHQLLSNLLDQQRSYVLNISSLAALSPMAYKTVYPASKAFVHSFTRGLDHEFSGSGLSLSVVNPGPMETNGDVAKNIEQNGTWAKVIHLYPEKVARISIEKMFKGEKVIKLNWLHRITLILLNLPAGIKMSILGRVFKKGQQKAET